MKLFKLLLLRFGEGGEGSASGASSEGTSGESIPSSIPERARKLYSETVGKAHSNVSEESKPSTEEAKPSKMTYEELIKSDDYKDAHKEYMEKTINDRVKKYKGVESENKTMRNALNTIALKYGIDSASETFMDDLNSAIEADDSYYEKYAYDHDMTPQDARKIVTLERKVRESEAEQARIAQEEAQREEFRRVQMNADLTKAKYASFDLSTELQNPSFVRILQATNGDTTAAYQAVHHDEIIRGISAMVAQEAKAKTANAMSVNSNRPIENGLSSSAPSQVQTDFSRMNLEQLRAYAEEQRRKMR